MPADKLHPRNRTARIVRARAAGNPVVTELESAVGNCYPGLEADVRNLERRFFPYLTVDFIGRAIVIEEVATGRAEDDGVTDPRLANLKAVARGWKVTRIGGTFAGFGRQTYTVSSLGGGDGPADAWTAVRLLRPGTEVELTAEGEGRSRNLTDTRTSYLRDDGALADMFQAGELTQSLCSPWTHDFRDCGCYYWASNHPDIVQPVEPAAAVGDLRYAGWVQWMRSDRQTSPPPEDRDHDRALAMDYFELNRRWPELDVVLDGREQRAPYAPDTMAGAPLADGELVPTLRYAAAVELAVMLEYLTAAYSLKLTAGRDGSPLRDDVRAAQSELLRVARSEMRHLRAVNDLLRAEHQASGAPGAFVPTLGVATAIPAGRRRRAVGFRPLRAAVLADFVRAEAPAQNVDAMYGHILATYQRDRRETAAATVAQVIAEGADHHATFRTMQEWLGRYDHRRYLLKLTAPAADDRDRIALQRSYEEVLDHLYRAFELGMPAGADELAAARTAMLADDGITGACERLVAAGRLPVFAVPDDARFAPVAPPRP